MFLRFTFLWGYKEFWFLNFGKSALLYITKYLLLVSSIYTFRLRSQVWLLLLIVSFTWLNHSIVISISADTPHMTGNRLNTWTVCFLMRYSPNRISLQLYVKHLICYSDHMLYPRNNQNYYRVKEIRNREIEMTQEVSTSFTLKTKPAELVTNAVVLLEESFCCCTNR